MAKKRNSGGGSPTDRPPESGDAPESGEAKPTPHRAPRSTAQTAVDWAKSIGGAVILFLILRTFLIQTFVITSSSMEETLLVGDFLILNKASYGPLVPWTDLRLPGYDDPERGDVVVFRPPHDPGLDVVKRLIGMPGDTLEMRDKTLYLNGEPLDEPYTRHSDMEGDVAHPWMAWQCGEPVALSPDISGAYRVAPGGTNGDGCFPSRDNWGPIVVPEDRLFLMGDNRDDSVDSRYWGYLDPAKLKGRAVLIYYSYDPEILRPFGFIRNIRADRIFDRIR